MKRITLSLLFLFCFLGTIGCASRAHTLNREGIEFAKAGKYNKALEKFQLAQKEDPKWSGIHLNLSRTYLMLGKPKEALISAQKAVSLNPKNLEAQLILIQAYFSNKQKQKAHDELDKLIKKYPKNHFLYMVQGDIFSSIGKWEEATNSYKKAIKYKPDSDRAYTQLGRIYLFKEMARYRNDMRIQVPKATNERDMMAKIGNLLSSGGLDLSKARAAFRKAVYLNSKNLQARTMLGLLAFYTASYDEAEIELTEALKLDPQNTYLYIALGMNAQKMEKYDEAEKFFNNAITITPDALHPKILKIFLYIEAKKYEASIQLALKLIKVHPEIELELFKTLKRKYFIHVPWLITMLGKKNNDISSFALQVLTFITDQPGKKEKQFWEDWWEKEKKKLIKKRQEMMKRYPRMK